MNNKEPHVMRQLQVGKKKRATQLIVHITRDECSQEPTIDCLLELWWISFPPLHNSQMKLPLYLHRPAVREARTSSIAWSGSASSPWDPHRSRTSSVTHG